VDSNEHDIVIFNFPVLIFQNPANQICHSQNYPEIQWGLQNRTDGVRFIGSSVLNFFSQKNDVTYLHTTNERPSLRLVLYHVAYPVEN
jgi:hypothetical protein